MIYQLTGNIKQISGNFIIIDVSGVGYGVHVPERLTGGKFNIDSEATLYTLTILRQDDISLYGFMSNMDREFFRMLLKIPRIGPKGALKILSTTSSVTIMQTILSGDMKTLSKFPGIGKKAAQRLIFELQEKVKGVLEKANIEYEDASEEVVEVLMSLGCDPAEARDMISKVLGEAKGKDLSFDDLLNESLRLMADEGR
ncbi:MAG: Holliday junction branch migration protein RuvA [Candidatus Eremiobacteraeota bacterium]|nr:Holliday junction branch migration protein RuvA [Candidatus Eremiobacteraeota bacterium]